MALYQMRQRDPLLDQGTQAMLERRSRELLGIGLVVVAVIFAAMLGSYSPDDPGWMVATEEPARNMLGRFGAAIASTLVILIGKGAWSIPVIFFAWGARFILHRGGERVLSRVVFAVIAVALASAYAATLSVPADWPHAFGLGGLFGDTVTGALVAGVIPGSLGFGLKVVSLLAFFSLLGMMLYVTGFDRDELRGIWHFLLTGSILAYAAAMNFMGKGGSAALSGAMKGARGLQDRAAAGRAAASNRANRYADTRYSDPVIEEWDEPPLMAPEARAPLREPIREEPMAAARSVVRRAAPQVVEPTYDDYEPAPLEAAQGWNAPSTLRAEPRRFEAPPSLPKEKLGFLARMRRVVEPEPELVEPEPIEPVYDMEQPSEDRIKARISDVIRSRARGGAPGLTGALPAPMSPLQAAVAARRAEPPLMRARRPQPLLADTRPSMMMEPPVTAVSAVVDAAPAPVAQATSFAAPTVEAVADHMDHTATEAPRPAAPAFLTRSRTAPAVAPIPAAAPPSPIERGSAFAAEEVAEVENMFVAEDMYWQENWDEASDDWHPDDSFEPDYDPTPVAPRALPRVAAIPERRAVVQAPVKRPIAQSTRAVAETQPRMRFEEATTEFELPPLGLLADPTEGQGRQLSDEALEENARMLESVLDDYGVKGEIVSVRPGPVVTMYELEPAPGLKASRVIGLADDIARSMSALSARVSTVPGRSVIGIELPNSYREKVVLKEILAARDFGDSQMRLPLALGKDIGGDPIVANLAKMPHLLIAGTTGSGKSVAINTMILSLLYKLTPEECRMIMIDPKMLELSVYDGIPHLLSPVVTDPKKAVVALKWVVGEMEERYRKMSKMGVRNIEGYNGRVRETLAKGEMFSRTIQTGFDEETGDPVFETEEYAPVAFPYIVVIVDEMADLMMVAGKEIEACIQRLAQMARASGIHLIMATQRPSVDVITGTIKANFPTRISFQVTSKIDSRTILGEQGAEQLLGQGDMLYMGNGQRIARIHGPFVSDEEVEEIVNHLKSFGPPAYMSGVVEGPDEETASDIDMVLGLGSSEGGEDALYDQAVHIVAKDRKCSTSYIQRKLGIGYNKAARLVEQMEEEGVVTAANHVGKREILVPEVH
ncbi:DNA translocase FtsK 4TM domain-containing protein [Xinfangfangia sp. CPCC 101601]|uniref:DNA translocase FtsK n=1 Tax=Pseudogemmobacter lacusdianii TaxID=3069608 RepID=A0ABU0VX43_9RHOB|nr:DNA translocase FtsK [Xinfangfangia sp. CPCC 101601]MDQ2066284.1 DNA translocase FtsK 4TM domain-containing protein [Xinfangfangia sp. CPCC 101601]